MIMDAKPTPRNGKLISMDGIKKTRAGLGRKPSDGVIIDAMKIDGLLAKKRVRWSKLNISKKKRSSRVFNMDNASIAKLFSRRLAYRRKWLGMSVLDVSEKAGIELDVIKRYESGSEVMNSVHLYKLAQVLDVQMSFFFCDEDGREYLPDNRHLLVVDLMKVSEKNSCADIPASKTETERLLLQYYKISDFGLRQKILLSLKDMEEKLVKDCNASS
jgi:transcriptional regulator with XRE-family HTH domain